MVHGKRIQELALQIAQDSKKVSEYLDSRGLPQPSFSIDCPVNLMLDSSEAEEARLSAISASWELADLLQGPVACLRPAINASSLEAIYRWNIPACVPTDGSEISFSALAEKCQLSEPNLRRIVRYAILYHRVFQEPRVGFVTHSAASILLVNDPATFDTLGMMFDESWQAFARTCDALQSFDGQEPNETAYSLTHAPSTSVWAHYSQNPRLAERFARSMESFTSSPGYSPDFLSTGYPWSRLPPHSTIIDMGGSQGHVSIAIATQHPELNFIVQDLPDVIEKARLPDRLEEAVKNRIKFQAHDFLTEQTTQGDVFLLRWVLHDWPDLYVVRILRNLRPALRPGNKILVNDQVMPEPGSVPAVVERQIRFFDMTMLAFFNARERDLGDWKGLFQEADERFQDINIWTPEGSAFSIIESTWIGEWRKIGIS